MLGIVTGYWLGLLEVLGKEEVEKIFIVQRQLLGDHTAIDIGKLH